MKRWNPLSLVVLLALSLAACMQPQAENTGQRQPVAEQPAAQAKRVPGEYLVSLVEGADPEAARALFADYGVSRWRHLRKDTYVVHLQSDPGPEAMARLAHDTATVRYIEPNRIYTTQ
ncbi:MAG: S8 family serine peptidase [Thiohalophilus sp.]